MNINVSHIAKLANLELTIEEHTKFEKQLGDVLDYVKQLEQVDTQSVESTSQVTGLDNVLREDNAYPSLAQDKAVSNAKTQYNNLFQVKGIFEE